VGRYARRSHPIAPMRGDAACSGCDLRLLMAGTCQLQRRRHLEQQLPKLSW
jgi:hypothetical protein